MPGQLPEAVDSHEVLACLIDYRERPEHYGDRLLEFGIRESPPAFKVNSDGPTEEQQTVIRMCGQSYQEIEDCV